VKVLTLLASQVAVAVENARLLAEVRQNGARLTRELRIAQEIQHALFPQGHPSGAGWEASAHFRPARELGGDLYDFYDMGGGLLGVATGDVAGRGVPAALFAAFASGTVRSRAFERRGRVSYEEVSVPLGMGDLVVFYTDGLVEARRGQEEYGQDRLLRGLPHRREGALVARVIATRVPVSRITRAVRYTRVFGRANWLC
jgi:serine phosphatase RsbU (regulator of sigma subunit)